MRRLDPKASVALKNTLETFEQRRTFIPLSCVDATPRSQETNLDLERDHSDIHVDVLAVASSWKANRRHRNRDVITDARNRPAPSFEASAAYNSVIRYQVAKARANAGKEQ